METRPSLSDTQPRTCPNCGASVSSRARTCLMCGAELASAVSPVARKPKAAPESAARAFPWPQFTARGRIIAIVAGVIVLLLAVSGVLLLRPGGMLQPPPAPTSTATPTPPPTETPTPRPPTPTVTSTPRPTETPIPPTKYTVRPGDTLSIIAEKFNTTIEAIQAFNGLKSTDVIDVGQVLQIPAAGATPGPTTTARPTETFVPGPTPGTVLHVVQSGDTLLGISLKYGVAMGVIQRANDIKDPESIRAGQQLVIPIGPTPTATAGLNATPTGPPRYAAPILLSPIEGQIFEGNEEPILLQWASVGILHENESYMVRLVQMEGSMPPQTFYTRATGWHIPVKWFPEPGDSHRTFQWQVRVVRVTGTYADGSSIYADAGASSVTRSFQWLIAPPTPTPTPGPTS